MCVGVCLYRQGQGWWVTFSHKGDSLQGVFKDRERKRDRECVIGFIWLSDLAMVHCLNQNVSVCVCVCVCVSVCV